MAGPWTQYQNQPGSVPAAAAKPWDAYRRPLASTAPEGIESTSTEPPKPGSGLLTRIWSGLTGQDSTKAGGFGMGLADPAVGLAQLGQHVFGTEAAFEAGLPAKTAADTAAMGNAATTSMDKAVAAREQQYQQGRAASGRLGADWMRLSGNIVSPANLPAAAATAGVTAGLGPAAGIVGQVARGALGGAAGGAAGAALGPVTGPDSFATQKAKQIGLGAAAGGALGAVAEPLVAAISGRNPAAVEQFIQQNYNRAVKPPLGQRSTASQVAASRNDVTSAISAIVNNKANLDYATPGGRIKGELPQTLEQMTEAIEQTRSKIFNEYDKMADAAGAAETGSNTTAPKILDAYATASRRASQAASEMADANRAVTAAAAKQARAGDNVYSASVANAARRKADSELATATIRLDKANAAKEAARRNMRGAWIDLDPIVGELRKIGTSTLADTHPNVVNHVNDLVKRLSARGAYSPSQAQEVIQRYNASLKAFYNNPTYENATLASVDSLVANRLRSSLDDMIEKTVGPGYQALKQQYGALKSIEKNVVRASIREANRTPGGGLLGAFGDIMSADEVLRGILTLNPKSVATGVLLKSAASAYRQIRSPNRAVRRLFQAADSASKPAASALRQGVGAALRPAPALIGGAVGREAPDGSMKYSWPDSPHNVLPPPGP